MIAAVVLAAGFARRMGRQKLLLELEGKPVVRWTVENVLPHVDDCVVVTGQDDAAVRAALYGLAVRFAVNPRPQDGQGSSIAVGVSPAIDYQIRYYDDGEVTIPQMYEDPEQARQDTATLHVHPLNWPRNI